MMTKGILLRGMTHWDNLNILTKASLVNAISGYLFFLVYKSVL